MKTPERAKQWIEENTEEKTNYVPTDAIKQSDEARKQQGKGDDAAKGDKFSEGRMATDVPSDEEAKNNPPNDKVFPG